LLYLSILNNSFLRACLGPPRLGIILPREVIMPCALFAAYLICSLYSIERSTIRPRYFMLLLNVSVVLLRLSTGAVNLYLFVNSTASVFSADRLSPGLSIYDTIRSS